MKKIFVFLIGVGAGLSIGAPIGWFLRKKTSEVQFVEVTEEEQNAQMIANGDQALIPVKDDEISRPADIQKAIDGVFARADIPDNLQETVQKDIENEKNREAGIRQLDTQKEQYFKKWKEVEALSEKYDTATKDLPEEVAELPDDVRQFVDDIDEEDAGEDDMATGRPTIDPASEEDWDRWTSKPDGAYDCVEVYWFDEDNVLSDEDGVALENPDIYLGFDVPTQFEKIKAEKGENEDVRYIYNHKQKAIFKLIRRHTSFSRKRGMEEFGSEYEDDEDDSDEYLRSRQ